MKQGRVQAVLFDWAGTVVDHGSRAPVEAFKKLFHRYGVELDEALIRRDMGMSKREHLVALLETDSVRVHWLEQNGGAVFEDIEPLYSELLAAQREAIAERAIPFVGVVDVVKFLEQRRIQMGTTTGYPASVIEELREIAAEHGYCPPVTVTDSDVPAGRPEPWMICRACEELRVSPFTEVVVVDDTVAGIEAARQAGCWAVGVTATGNLVALEENQLSALASKDREALFETAATALTGAGAHFVVPSVVQIPEVINQIDALLANGTSPV